MTGAPPFARIVDEGPVSVDFVAGPGDELALSFASIGADPLRPPAPEFVASACGGKASAPRRSALFFTDASRSWANAPEFAPALAKALDWARARRPFGRTVAIGHSMGGFMALVAATLAPVDAVLAFSPQSTLVPAETRWARWTGRLADAPRLRAPAPDARGAQVYLFHGLVDDREQAFGFPARAGVDHLLFPDCGHSDLVLRLKDRGCLAGLVDAAFAQDRRRLLRIAASAGAVSRRRIGIAAGAPPTRALAPQAR